MNAVDTNILIYSIDTRAPVKQAKAAALLQGLTAGKGSTVLFWQALAESVNQLRRWKDLGILAEAEFDQHVQSWRSMFPIVFPPIGVLDHALDLAKRNSLSHWDSMILGACKEAGVTNLYTEDMGAPTVIDGIQLVNPLI
jgi:predicted nucleic acid-binding protein